MANEKRKIEIKECITKKLQNLLKMLKLLKYSEFYFLLIIFFFIIKSNNFA